MHWPGIARQIARTYHQDPLVIWRTWSPRQLLEHYPDAVRQERKQWMTLQCLMSGKGFAEVDWDWLDALERARWCDGNTREPLTPRKTMKQLFEEARARPVTDSDREALKAWADGGYKTDGKGQQKLG